MNAAYPSAAPDGAGMGYSDTRTVEKAYAKSRSEGIFNPNFRLSEVMICDKKHDKYACKVHGAQKNME